MTKFDLYWRIVKEGLDESDLMKTNFINFEGGHKYEAEDLLLYIEHSLYNDISFYV